MDEVIADVTPKFLDYYEQATGKRLAKPDYWGRKIYEVEGGEHIRSFLFEKGFFADLPVMEGAQEVVRWLHEHYEIYVVTAAMEFPTSLEDKYFWMHQHFPFIHWKNFVFCGDKSIVQADYMIDDHVKNLLTFQGKGLLYTSTHNIHETRFTRVNNWAEVATFFENEIAHGK